MRSWCVSLLLFASACGGGLERATFVTDRLEYASSDRAMLSLVNVGNSPLTVQLCTAVLEAERSRVPDVDPSPTPCDEAPTTLGPGERVSQRRLLRVNSTVGGPVAMRFRVGIGLVSGDTEEVFTPVFSVGSF